MFISISGPGENKDTEQKRLTSWTKGCTKGQCDLLTLNNHKHYGELAIEFGIGRLSSEQSD